MGFKVGCAGFPRDGGLGDPRGKLVRSAVEDEA